jgi:hypothetical protein
MISDENIKFAYSNPQEMNPFQCIRVSSQVTLVINEY